MRIITILSTLLFSISSFACIGGSHQVHDGATLTAKSINIKMAKVHDIYEPITVIEANIGTKFTFANTGLMGATPPTVEVVEQDKDNEGIFSTTYTVKVTGVYPGAVEKTQRVKVKSNYAGNGNYSRGGCSVEITEG